MMHCFFDSDVILDLLTDRQPFSKHSTRILDLAARGKVKGYTSAIAICNIQYILSGIRKIEYLNIQMEQLSDFLEIIPVDVTIISAARKSGFKDFEDAVQYYSAASVSAIKVIITRNIKDYKLSQLPVMTPESFLGTYEQI